MNTTEVISMIFGIIICLGLVIGVASLVYRFRHGIKRALGIVTLVFLVLAAVAIVGTYARSLIYLIPLAILIFVVWIFTRR